MHANFRLKEKPPPLLYNSHPKRISYIIPTIHPKTPTPNMPTPTALTAPTLPVCSAGGPLGDADTLGSPYGGAGGAPAEVVVVIVPFPLVPFPLP